jgi:hypothetical protein
MKKLILYTALLLFLTSSSSIRPVFSGVYEPDKLRVHLRMDKKIFFSDEEVTLQICVKNISEKKNYFEVYDSLDNESSNYTTFQPLVFDMKGREAEITVPYKIEKRDISEMVRGLEKRMVELAPGESFIHTVNLKDLFSMNLNTRYRIQGLFYPAFEENTVVKSDNELMFKIVEAKRYNKPSEVDAIERSVSPKEVILLTLKAEKDRDWDTWIKYINIEKYINAYPEFVQKYIRANYEEKSLIEKDFIKYTTRDRDDYLVNYRIVRESVETDRKIAYVDVIEERYGIRWNYRYKYRYTLEQYKNLWLITDEEATVMKGIKK